MQGRPIPTSSRAKPRLASPRWLIPFVLSAPALLSKPTPEPSLSAPAPQAVQGVLAGKRTVARAAWWGLDEEDATEALQAAILSGAKRVIVPNLGRDWVVKPIRLAPNLELVLEPGVVITAKRGEYTGKTDSVFTAQDVVHFSLDSYGAVIRMQKLDYVVGKVSIEFGWDRWFGHYERAERRMALALRGCENVRIYGVTLRDSGGDGI